MDDFSLDELKLAFAYQLVNRILDVAGDLAPAEAGFLERSFPPEVFAAAGFVTNGVFTDRYREALVEALLRLPVDLDAEERLALIESLWRAAQADGVLEAGEAQAVAHAGRLLGLPPEQVSARFA